MEEMERGVIAESESQRAFIPHANSPVDELFHCSNSHSSMSFVSLAGCDEKIEGWWVGNCPKQIILVYHMHVSYELNFARLGKHIVA